MRRTALGALLLAGAGLSLFVVAPATASAHGFGERYDLPVPLSLYIGGAGAVVVLSFIVIGLFVRGQGGSGYPRVSLLRWSPGRALAHPAVLEPIRTASLLLFLVYLAAGLFGNQDPSRNLVPTMTWVVFWVGIAYVSAFVGNAWALVSPWKVLFGYADALYYRIFRSPLSRYEPYPEGLGAWPAVVLFLAFAWVEVVYTNSGVPLDIAVLVLGYTAITFIGMFWYGRDEWLRHGEAFAIALGYLAAFAPTEVRVRATDDGEESVNDYEAYAEAEPEHREWNIRPWGAGLLAVKRLSVSHSVLLILMLSTVTFDGFAETPAWTRILISWQSSFSVLGVHAFSGITTMGLLVAPLLFFGVFALAARTMTLLASGGPSTLQLIGTFAYSLVPIALAYHVAHFFSFLMIQGQRMAALVSDPFGQGWDIFGTADVGIDITVINARFVWMLSVVAVVVGHVVAVFLAHAYAERSYPTRVAALRSQYPMLLLMVGYTMASLWIVAQPIVEP
jgi:hypothetical protein